MRRRALIVMLMAMVGGIAGTAPASAEQSPDNCNANRLHLDIVRDHSLVRNGDIINYTLDLDNVGLSACDVSNINIKLQFPGPDGKPSPTMQTITTAAGYPAQMPLITFGPFAYTVNANPGVTSMKARTTVVDGLLHSGDSFGDVDIDKSIDSTVMRPAITIDKVGSMTGPAPADQTVTYTFYVKNGTLPATPEASTALSNVTVTDDKCGSPAYVSGDADGDTKLDTSETWAFTCTLDHQTAGTYTNKAVANGENILYGRSVPVVSPPDTWTVVLTTPPPTTPPPATPPPATPPPATPAPATPAAPVGAVLPASQTQAACILSTPNAPTVRAGELTTVRVRVQVDKPVSGSLVRITIPGGKVVRARTNASGIATFRLRSPRSGRLVIRAAECSDVERLTVRAARKVAARRLPRVTG